MHEFDLINNYLLDQIHALLDLNFFLEDSQTKFLNALLDNVGKKLRSNNE